MKKKDAVPVYFFVPSGMKADLRRLADSEGLSLSAFIRRALAFRIIEWEHREGRALDMEELESEEEKG